MIGSNNKVKEIGKTVSGVRYALRVPGSALCNAKTICCSVNLNHSRLQGGGNWHHIPKSQAPEEYWFFNLKFNEISLSLRYDFLNNQSILL